MESLKEQQERVRRLILDTVNLLCKNGITFKKELKVEGLLGITVDEDSIFIVHFNENSTKVTVATQNDDRLDSSVSDKVKNSINEQKKPKQRKRRSSRSSAKNQQTPQKIQLMSKSDVVVVDSDDENDVKLFAAPEIPLGQNYAAAFAFPNYDHSSVPMVMVPPQYMPTNIGLNSDGGQYNKSGSPSITSESLSVGRETPSQPSDTDVTKAVNISETLSVGIESQPNRENNRNTTPQTILDNRQNSVKQLEPVTSQKIPAKSYMCQFCDRIFRTQITAILHERTHTGQKSFLCEYCNEGFYSKHKLKVHRCKNVTKK